MDHDLKNRLTNLGRKESEPESNFSFNNPVGTVVAHADHVTLQYKENE
jgi:hypothetical protein